MTFPYDKCYLIVKVDKGKGFPDLSGKPFLEVESYDALAGKCCHKEYYGGLEDAK